MAVQKAKGRSVLSWPRHHKIVSILIMAVVIAGAYFAYEAYAGWQNKRDFQRARAAIDTIYADIVSQVGQPDNYDRYNSCGINHAEFGDSPLSCSLNTDLIFSVSNDDDANVILRRVQNIIDKSYSLIPQGTMIATLQDHLVTNMHYYTASNDYIYKGLVCVVNYIYDTPQETNLVINDPTKKTLQINIGCSGIARANFY